MVKRLFWKEEISHCTYVQCTVIFEMQFKQFTILYTQRYSLIFHFLIDVSTEKGNTSHVLVAQRKTPSYIGLNHAHHHQVHYAQNIYIYIYIYIYTCDVLCVSVLFACCLVVCALSRV